MIHLPNGNVKFSDTNLKHFTVGDPMAFPIVKMGNKIPQNLPFLLHDMDPHLIQRCLGPLQAPLYWFTIASYENSLLFSVQTERAYHVERTSTLELGKSVLFAQHIALCFSTSTSPKMMKKFLLPKNFEAPKIMRPSRLWVLQVR